MSCASASITSRASQPKVDLHFMTSSDWVYNVVAGSCPGSYELLPDGGERHEQVPACRPSLLKSDFNRRPRETTEHQKGSEEGSKSVEDETAPYGAQSNICFIIAWPREVSSEFE